MSKTTALLLTSLLTLFYTGYFYCTPSLHEGEGYLSLLCNFLEESL